MSDSSSLVRVRYPDGRSVSVPVGSSVLAASFSAKIPHAAICGGRGRCSSCRVRVSEGLEHQPPPDKAELATLRPLSCDPTIRLGCRLKVQADLTVEPLIPMGIKENSPELAGRLMAVTVMFVDMRGYSRMAARMHPFDVVFTLNRYFDVVAQAVVTAGGVVDKFMGDGVMALFGLGEPEAIGAAKALTAARAIAFALDQLNRELAAELSEPLRIGIGIHCGPAIVGRFGWGGKDAGVQTAIGDVVNIASRLEGLTKPLACQLVMSEQVAEALGEERQRYPEEQVQLPNYDGEIWVRSVIDARNLP